jgi:Ribosome recycling factor
LKDFATDLGRGIGDPPAGFIAVPYGVFSVLKAKRETAPPEQTKFYLDEHIPSAVTEGLRRRGKPAPRTDSKFTIRHRNIRRDGYERLKKMLKDKQISEDNERDGLEEIQKLTNTYIGKIDELSKSKEHEITSV